MRPAWKEPRSVSPRPHLTHPGPSAGLRSARTVGPSSLRTSVLHSAFLLFIQLLVEPLFLAGPLLEARDAAVTGWLWQHLPELTDEGDQ